MPYYVYAGYEKEERGMNSIEKIRQNMIDFSSLGGMGRLGSYTKELSMKQKWEKKQKRRTDMDKADSVKRTSTYAVTDDAENRRKA